MQTQYVSNIERYRESKAAGNIKIKTTVNEHRAVTVAIEQTLYDTVTKEEKLSVIPNTDVDRIKQAIVKEKRYWNEGAQALELKGDTFPGIQALQNQIEQFENNIDLAKKQIADATRRRDQLLADWEEMLTDTEEAVKKAEKKYDDQVAEATEAAKKVVEKSSAKKTNA